MSPPLTTRIPIRDRDGRVVDEKEVATYAGLLAKAHEAGLSLVETELVQVPCDENFMVAICLARVVVEHGTFTGIGDASPESVNSRIVPHIIRMAETRAKARALRDAVNIGTVALEELGDLSEIDVDRHDGPRPGKAPDNVRSLPPRRERRSPVSPRGDTRSNAMSQAQRRLLFRILAEHGYEGDEATQVLCHAAEVESLDEITKRQASSLIDAWKNDEPVGGHRAS